MLRIPASLMLLLSLTLAAGHAAAISCPADAVAVGPVSIDRYEASVWAVPRPTTSNKALVTKLKKGIATLGDLVAGGAAAGVFAVLGYAQPSTPNEGFGLRCAR